VRVAILAILISTASLAPSSARAATPADASDPNVSKWAGRYCTPTGCAGDPSSTVAQAAGFGVASLAIIFRARRRRA